MLPFKKGVVVDATEMGTIVDLPDSCAIIGGGVIAVEYANVLAGLGVGVSLLCKDEVRRTGAAMCIYSLFVFQLSIWCISLGERERELTRGRCLGRGVVEGCWINAEHHRGDHACKGRAKNDERQTTPAVTYVGPADHSKDG